MKFRDALERTVNSPLSPFIAEDPSNQGKIDAVRTFLKTPGAVDSELLNHPLLQGKGFEFIGTGEHGFVVGNKTVVVKMGESYKSYDERASRGIRPPSIPTSEIPAGLAAKVEPHGEGEINGVPYLICERLRTKPPATLEEIVSHLFKCREAGVMYAGAIASNYGRDAEGNVLVLDHSHFMRYDEKIFGLLAEGAIKKDMGCRKFPMIFSDKKNTYILFDAVNPTPPATVAFIRSALDAVGLTPQVEAGSVLMMIPQTEVRAGYDPSSRRQPLAEYLKKALKSQNESVLRGKPGRSFALFNYFR